MHIEDLQLYQRDSNAVIFLWILQNFLTAPFLQNISKQLLQSFTESFFLFKLKGHEQHFSSKHRKKVWFCCSVFAAFSSFLIIKYFWNMISSWPTCATKTLCLFYNMSSQEEHNKLTNEEKFKLNEFYKVNSDLWVTQGTRRSQKGLKKEELWSSLMRNFQSRSWNAG